MNLTNTKPIPKIPSKYYLLFIVALLLAGVLLSSIADNIRNRAVQEYLDQNYNDLYDSAYQDGFNDGYEEGEMSFYESISSPLYVSKCDQCHVEYDPTGIFNFGFGLCDDCGRAMISDCIFCSNTTFAWGDSWYAVCPDCMGDAVALTDIEEFLEAFNESR